jgi:FkbM family methyltransferase
MLIDLQKITKRFQLKIHGVLHIGAHYGQEYEEYLKLGVKNMIFFEPIKDNYEKLVEHIPSEVLSYNLALGNEIGPRKMFVEKIKGQSCSILEPGTHLELHPHIKFTDQEIVSMVKLDVLNFNRKLYNMINIDVQGYELEVFKGSITTLPFIDIIYTEVNFEEVYKGCCLIEELDEFLKPFGFIRVLTKDSTASRTHNTWGDALYLKK